MRIQTLARASMFSACASAIAALSASPSASHAAQSAQFVNDEGLPYLVTLSGPGSFELTQDAQHSGIIESLTLTGTTAASRLVIVVKRTAEGPGWVGLNSLHCATPLGAFLAPDCGIDGDGLDFSGGVSRIVVGDVHGPIQVGADERRVFAPLTIQAAILNAPVACPARTLRVVAKQVNGADISAGAVTEVRAGGLDGTVRAKLGIGRIRIGGSGGLSGVLTARSIGSIRVDRSRNPDDSGGGSMSACVVAALRIGSIRLQADMSNCFILAGTQLGGDAALGGAGTDEDSVQAGTLASVSVAGDVSGTILGAGYSPVDGVYGNEDDGIVGGADSRIGSVTVGESFGGASWIGAGRFGPIVIARRRVRPDDMSPFVTRRLQ